MKGFKKVVCTALSAALVVGSVAACSKSDKGGDNEDLEDVVSTYLDNIIDFKVGKNAKIVEDGEDAVGAIDYNATTEVIQALITNAGYEITESDVNKKKGEVTVEISTIAIDEILEYIGDDDLTVDAFIDAIEDLASDDDCFEAEEFTFELVQDGDDWLISSDSTEDFVDYLMDLVDDVDFVSGGGEVEPDETIPTTPTTDTEPTDTEPTETDPTDIVNPDPTETEPIQTQVVTNISGTTYVSEYDMTDLMMENIGITGYQPVGTVNMVMNLVLGDDGTFSLGCDTDAFSNSVSTFFSDNMLPMMASMYGMSEAEIQALLSSSGMTVDALIQESLESADYGSLQNTATGTYSIDGNQIALMIPGAQASVGTISGNTITLSWDDPSIGNLELVFVEQ